MATVEGDENSEFSAAVATSLDSLSFTHPLRMSRQNISEGLLSLEEYALAVLPTGFGKNVITTLCVRG